MEVCTRVSFRLNACSLGPRRLADSTGHGSLYSSSFPAPTSVQVSFVYSERKEETWRVWGRTGCALSKVLGFDFFFFCVSGGGERERVRETWAYRIAVFFFTLLCVLGSLLIDGLHIPIVTSLRRLSTVGCGGMGAMCLKKRTGRISPRGQEGRRIV